MADGILSREEIGEIVADLRGAVDSNDHEAFLRIFLDGALRFEDRKLGRDCIADAFIMNVLSESLEYGQNALAVLKRAVDMFWELSETAETK